MLRIPGWVHAACLLGIVGIGGCGAQLAGPTKAAPPSVPIVSHLEERPPGEAAAIADVVDHAVAVQKERYCGGNPDAPCCRADADWKTCADEPYRPDEAARRDAHAKHHGCVRAHYATRDDVPAELAVGVFAPGSHFDAWLRFSNGNPRVRADAEPDGRGVAVKLLDVPGDKLLASVLPTDEKRTQDFLLINHPVFFVPDIETYGEFLKASDSDGSLRLGFFFLWHLRLFGIARALQGQDVYSPLEIEYHSMTAYLLGNREAGVAVKYWIVPVECASGAAVPPQPRPREADDYLRQAMVERLAPGPEAEPVCLDLRVLARRDANDASRPVEDPTREWDPATTPKTTVARITIPPQRFASPEQLAFCEDLSFTPWHALPAHQPLGRLNRLRLEVYRAIAELRHRLNRSPPFEPKGFRDTPF